MRTPLALLADMKIGRRLGLGFATLSLLLLVLGAFAMVQLNGTQATVSSLTRQDVPPCATSAASARSWPNTA